MIRLLSFAVLTALALPARAQVTTDAVKLAKDVTANAPAATINADVAQLATDSGHATATLDHGKIAFNIGAATGLDLFAIAKGSNGKYALSGPTQGAGGVLFDFGFDKAPDGNSRYHLSPAVLVGAGTFDGKPAPVVTIGALLGFGGFDKIPLFGVGPALAQPLVSNTAPQFQLLASIAAVFEIQQLAGSGG